MGLWRDVARMKLNVSSCVRQPIAQAPGRMGDEEIKEMETQLDGRWKGMEVARGVPCLAFFRPHPSSATSSTGGAGAARAA